MKIARAREPEPIAKIINSVVGKWIEEKGGKEDTVSSVWEKVAGKKIVRHAEPRRLYRKTLVVEVDSPVWFYELNTNHKQQLLAELQKALGKEKIEKILFRPKR